MKTYQFIVRAWASVVVEAETLEEAQDRVAEEFSIPLRWEHDETLTENNGQPVTGSKLDRLKRESTFIEHEPKPEDIL